MNGVLILDKPQGVTSHDVVQRVRRLLKERRVGHAGTLDPMATGLMQVAVGEGTRLVQFLMEGEKTYRGTLKLGETTDTLDAEGIILERRPVGELSADALERACTSLTGTIRQTPPMYSALKKNGVPLHKLARRGEVVDRPEREVFIRRLKILEIDLPRILFEVDCSKGTYVRTLAHDMGAILGPGAHLTALRRIRSGVFGEESMITLPDLELAVGEGRLPILTPREAMRHYPALSLSEEAGKRLRNGIPPQISETAGELPRPGQTVSLVDGDRLMAVAVFDPERETERRGDFRLHCVFP